MKSRQQESWKEVAQAGTITSVNYIFNVILHFYTPGIIEARKQQALAYLL